MESVEKHTQKTYKGVYLCPFRCKNLTDSDCQCEAENRSDAEFDLIFEYLKSHLEKWGKKNNFLIDFTKPDHNMFIGLVDENVKKHIEINDFIIADISGDNKNIFLELGYVDGKGKPYIIISQGDINLELPIDKQSRLISGYNPQKLMALYSNLVPKLKVLIREINERQNAADFTLKYLYC